MATTRLRPRSPDIQIYRPQLTSVLSILHRITGVLLSVGSVLLVAWLVAVADGGDAYAMADRWLRSWVGMLLLLGWIFALFYHLCNGIRHLAWDLDFGFELGSIYRSGWTVVAVSVILTLLTWTLGLAGGE
ncbi:succinate dehydrogenase, cytochrome b556 subunit [Rhodanobacter thiooxydans]|uniref:Succinate dehydrogenase cytochrome b556 subunit n=1 Tax=Rhodanobacter thiooxydans TaxID=416169 RepID=A0A154QGY8_9GAMM|nr:succinate dehydrogenase, cytochrome b556 subunit [Rhodanobacter thiooxydans]KZC23436.1 succinate dehydrogenase, cytochrome b556 subunit [Rhodanobacter thiooxydans]MCW0200330.1 succinate dehydrogenase, cytochrome b556 subunit [Rhodanobacter thiooxydans]